MVCRVWRGWTTLAHAQSYDDYLQQELFPRLDRDLQSHGYCGYQLLRLARGDEVEFMTMLWFDSIENVRAFAGESYERPVISEKAQSLLARFADRADHYQLSGSNLLDVLNAG
jgi:antibiotic biosynthesis monooxygenase (ABM) superfamily enzyme